MKKIKRQGLIINSLTDPHSWVVKYADYLFNYAVSRINDEEMARDLIQETFLAALERKDNFEGHSTEKTWLTAILKYKIIDVYRKKSRMMPEQAFLRDDVVSFFNPDDGHWNEQHRPKEMYVEQPDALLSKEFSQILNKCMNKLPNLWLAVFTMKHMDQESTPFICRELKVTPSNFWVIIHRTKVNLRACLEKNWN